MTKKKSGAMNKKQAISPVITTVLLVLLAVILAAIIFIWARNFVKETLIKSGESIDKSCDRISIQASISGQELMITNTGQVAIYNIKVYNSGSSGDSDSFLINQSLSPGQSFVKNVPGIASGS